MTPRIRWAAFVAACLALTVIINVSMYALGVESLWPILLTSAISGAMLGVIWGQLVPTKRPEPKRETVTVWSQPRQLIAERTDLHFDLHDEQGTPFMHLLVFRDGAGCIGGVVIPRRLVQEAGEQVLEHAARVTITDMEA